MTGLLQSKRNPQLSNFSTRLCQLLEPVYCNHPCKEMLCSGGSLWPVLQFWRRHSKSAVALLCIQVEAGLDALNGALAAGFEDFAKVRSDPNMENLRSSDKFKRIIDRYDEPFINESAVR